jgi:hypothetical protein
MSGRRGKAKSMTQLHAEAHAEIEQARLQAERSARGGSPFVARYDQQRYEGLLRLHGALFDLYHAEAQA